MATVAEMNTLCDAAVTAIAAGDYATALNKMTAAAAILNIIPAQAENGGANVKFTAQWINQQLQFLDKKAREQANNARGGIQISKFKHTRVSGGF